MVSERDVLRMLGADDVTLAEETPETGPVEDDTYTSRPVDRASLDADRIAGQMRQGRPTPTRRGGRDRPSVTACERCGAEIAVAARGPIPRWCSRRCSPWERARAGSRRRGADTNRSRA